MCTTIKLQRHKIASVFLFWTTFARFSGVQIFWSLNWFYLISGYYSHFILPENNL